jgi:outer membrane receptor protein involved in Fe transport
VRHQNSKTVSRLLCGSAAIALSWSGLALAEERAFDIQAQPLATALMAFGNQSGHAVMAPMELMEAKVTRGFQAPAEPEVALAQLLEGTGLTFTRTGDTFAIVQGGSSDPQPQGAAGGGAEGTVEALIVTAQKREEDIQDVPIAI